MSYDWDADLKMVKTLNLLLDRGVNFIDTQVCYGGSEIAMGESEPANA